MAWVGTDKIGSSFYGKRRGFGIGLKRATRLDESAHKRAREASFATARERVFGAALSAR
jgi:hypothetical protein